MTWERIIFAVLFAVSLGVFFANLYRLFAMLCLGRWENRFDHLGRRIINMFEYGFGQLRVIRTLYGFNHFVIFWGFMILLLMNGEFLVQGLFPAFSLSFIGETPYGILLAVSDVVSLLVLVAIAAAVARRTLFRPSHIEPTMDAFVILGLIASLMVAYFGYHAGEIRLQETPFAGWMPLSGLFAGMMSGMSDSATHTVTRVFWWIHALVLLAFLNYLPYSKHLHVITAIPNCFFRSFDFVKTVPRLQFQLGNYFGNSKIIQFTWKNLLDFLACTECGRCQQACPAHNTGKVLNPREVIHKGKLNLFANGKALLATRPLDTLDSVSVDAEMKVPLIGDSHASFTEQELWDCTTCGACMAICPVFIEHAPKVVELRRHLVMEESQFPEELLQFFLNMEQRYNPWGIAPSDRAKWAQDLDVKIVSEQHPAEYLYFVGCAGAYDSRNRTVALAMARIMDAAGLDWGILGTAEKCCGDSLRRLGNEYVFEQIAKDNVEQFKKLGVKKIVTHCPHCFNTLKNDYEQFGADFEIIHHSQLIENLILTKKLPLAKRVNGTTVYHDSCYLGRYNDIYDEPREVLRAVSGGNEPEEMQRNGQQSFCCGAGGGRMWLEEMEGKRIYLERTQEAMKCNPSTIAVACPFCLTMFEDGVKDIKAEDKVKVRDLAEIVSDALN